MVATYAAVLGLATLAAGQDVYRLKFLSDYQEGDWDTDAAENVAYDTLTNRAFVASAESIDVNVLDFSNPTAPTKTGTISVAADLEFGCLEADCIYEVMDFGGAGAPCGFADVLKIVHDREDFSCCGWFGGEFVHDPTMTSAEACQALCAGEPGCSYFSFENECEQVDGVCTDVRHNECYLKSDFTAAQAAAAGFGNAGDCFSYVAWEDGPTYDLHSYDENWFGASGPEVCGMVRSESVQSVAVVYDELHPNGIVAAAAPHIFEWANGYLAFYDAATLSYMGCAEAGNKPEGITSHGDMVACINEGSAREDGLVDHDGSMTLCEIQGVAGATSFECTNYHFVEENFATGAWVSAIEFRSRDLRLYGPNADDIGMDLEPEHGVFVLDGAYLVVSFQDNNGYAYFDTSSKLYTYMGGYGYIPATLDASDRDGFINIKSDWGGTSLWGIPMPDQIATVTVGGNVYILTANEGDTRDGEDIIGTAEADDGTEFEGEETRYGDLGSPSVATCATCAADDMLGRILTTTYMPTDFATNACGLNSCSAEELSWGLGDAFSCIFNGADYGGNNPLCGFAGNPTDAYYVNDAAWEAPGWYSGTVTVDETMTSPQACQALCAAHSECDFFSYEFELGVHECLFKLALTDCPYQNYVRWWQHWEDANWAGWSGPGTCPYSKAPYTSDPDTSDVSGSAGGSYSIGTRSFTIWKMPDQNSPLELVFDSGSMFEEVTAAVANGLCDGCMTEGTPENPNCDTECPFNSDEAPPALDDRSDAKGPEPECITTGTMADGTILAFIGLERTGGVVVYDVSDPENPVYQDFLNVRNWLVGDTVTGDEDQFYVDHALNDGPENLVFVSAADSPIGQEMLIAVAPLAGRTTAYILEKTAPRADDGSCMNIATCEYLPTALGGTGAALGLTVADVCMTQETCEALGEFDKFGGGSGSKKKKSSNNSGLVAAIVVVCIFVVIALILAGVFFFRSKTYESKYNNLMTENAIHQQETEMSGTKKAEA